MKKLLLLSGVCFSCLSIFAQQNTVATGGDASGSGGSMSYSIGQIDYFNASSSGGEYNQGVQQPYEFFNDVGIEENGGIAILLHPNPSTDLIQLNVSQVQKDLYYEIYNNKGQVVRRDDVLKHETTIDLKEISAGEYHFALFGNQQIIQTIKLIKH